MTEREKLSDAIKLIAWGYVLLHLNINLGSLNILPNWLGYVLMLNALPAIALDEPSALLLRPLGVVLALSLISTALALYFHFQLLTNLAAIAEKHDCPERKKILTLRTVRTILITLIALPFAWEQYTALTVGMVIVHLIVAIWICSVLFSLRRSLIEPCEEAAED